MTERAALEYARAVHGEVRDANRELYTRAQIVLTLDGIVVGAVGAALAAQRGDLESKIAVFGITTWAAVSLAAVSLIASVLSSVLALFSRHMQSPPNLRPAAYEPGSMWFYARIAELDPRRFLEVAEGADAVFETRARLAQVTIMAPIMVRRARWLNRAFGTTGLLFVCLALAALDYVIRVAA